MLSVTIETVDILGGADLQDVPVLSAPESPIVSGSWLDSLGTLDWPTQEVTYEAQALYVTADGAPAGGTHVTTPGVTAFGVDVDGVAELLISTSGGTRRCTGSLLYTGQHIVTAANSTIRT